MMRSLRPATDWLKCSGVVFQSEVVIFNSLISSKPNSSSASFSTGSGYCNTLHSLKSSMIKDCKIPKIPLFLTIELVSVFHSSCT